MTRTKVRTTRTGRQRCTSQSRTASLTLEQEQALGDLALLGGPAFLIGLWGLAAFVSGLISTFTSMI